jgi:hypothetical protein
MIRRLCAPHSRAFRKSVAIVALIVAMPGTLWAETVASAFAGFGLPGTWAPECGEAPTPLHPHAIYLLTPSGEGHMVYRAGATAPESAYAVTGAERATGDKLLLQEEWLHDHSRLDVTLRKYRGKLKVWLSRDEHGGVLVKDGVVAATGYVSPWMTRCGG